MEHLFHMKDHNYNMNKRHGKNTIVEEEHANNFEETNNSLIRRLLLAVLNLVFICANIITKTIILMLPTLIYVFYL
jgi:hypothetical protein